MNTDERRGAPSASGLERLMNCPPSFEMERLCPEPEELPEAASGTRIHAVLALQASTDTLDVDELETCERCTEQAQRVIQEWHGPGAVLADKTLYERRLGLTALGTALDVTPDSKATFIFTGQADLIVIKNGRALVIDYKTGRGDVAVATENPQLAGLAVLVWLRYKVTDITVAIVQPWAGPPTIGRYGENALTLARSWLVELLDESKKATPDQARPDEWCKYCKAKALCENFKTAALRQVDVLRPESIAGLDGAGQRAAMFARAMELPASRLAAAMHGLPMVERYVEAIKGAGKTRAADDPEFQQFFFLRAKKGKRSVERVAQVFSALAQHGVTPEAFAAECSISIKSVRELLRKATGAKGKALDALEKQALDGATETGKGSLELCAVGSLPLDEET